MSIPEVWLRGPLPDVPPLLMPVAHALLQVREDVRQAVEGLTPEQIWTRPAGAASTGFHVRHLSGALERLLTYARGEMLSREQVEAVVGEGEPGQPPADAAALVRLIDAAVEQALAQVRATPEATLLEARGVGRRRLPSTVVGLLFHAAEHSTRHAGQAITTARIVRGPQ
jgi:uncharacterized damage-inducible protein DinB